MRIKDKLENYSTVDQVLDDLIASIPEEEVERRTDAKSIFKELKAKVMRDEALERGQSARRAQVRRDPADHHRSRRAAADARIDGVHARRNGRLIVPNQCPDGGLSATAVLLASGS